MADGVVGTTQPGNDNSDLVATTLYVDSAIGGDGFWQRTSTVISPTLSGDSLDVSSITTGSITTDMTTTNELTITAPPVDWLFSDGFENDLFLVNAVSSGSFSIEATGIKLYGLGGKDDVAN